MVLLEMLVTMTHGDLVNEVVSPKIESGHLITSCVSLIILGQILFLESCDKAQISKSKTHGDLAKLMRLRSPKFNQVDALPK